MSADRRHDLADRWRVVTALAVGALVTLSGCAAGPTARTATPTTPAIPLPAATQVLPPTPVGGALGRAPTDCPSVPPPQTFTMASGFGGGFGDPVSFLGGAPVWELGLRSSYSAGQFRNPGSPYPSFKAMWIVGPNVDQPVTLTGQEVHTGALLWFEIYPSNTNSSAPSVFTTHAVLDPNAPNRGSTDNSKGHWNIWGIGLVPLAAGCYQLDVSWPAGHWSAMFAAGA